MSKYDFDLELYNENSLSIILNMVNLNSKILEFGPAHGRLTRYLKEKLNCEIDIVEIDYEAGINASKYARLSCVGSSTGDIEKYIWLDKFKNEKYDFIIFADVLEHLYTPWEVLKRCNMLLKDDGSILVSIPNISHNSIIINLINDVFDYNETGLLDNTHIRFFTYNSFKKMIENNGYICVKELATYSRVGENEIKINYNLVSKELAKILRNRDKGSVYQFIFEIKKQSFCFSNKVSSFINIEKNSRYKLSCYIKEEKDTSFTENKVIKKFINPSENTLKISFNNYSFVNSIRIDPIDSNCCILVKNLYGICNKEQINLEIDSSNGLKLFESLYIFSNSNPQLYIDFKGLSITEINFKIEFIDYDSLTIETYFNIFNNIIKKIILKDKEIESAKVALNEKDEEIESAKLALNEKDKEIESAKVILNEKDKEIESAKVALNEKDEEIESAKTALNEKDKEIESAKLALNEKDKEIESAKVALNEKDKEIESAKVALNEKDEEIESAKTALNEKDKEIEFAKVALSEKDEEIESAKTALNEKDKEIESAKVALNEKDEEIESAKTALNEKDKEIESAKVALNEKDKEIEITATTIEYKNKEIESAHISLKNAESEINTINEILEQKKNELELAKRSIFDKIKLKLKN